MSKRRRTNPNNKFVMLERWFWRCPAWQALPHPARSLYVELEMLYTGTNNGELFLSIRDAAMLLRTGARQARTAFQALEAGGFIRTTRKGSRTRRGEKRLASCWRLTKHADDVSGAPATSEFMTPRKNPTVSPQDTDRVPTGHGAPKNDRQKAPDRVPTGHAQADFEAPTVSPEDTHLIYQHRAPENQSVNQRAAPPSAAPCPSQASIRPIDPETGKPLEWRAPRMVEIPQGPRASSCSSAPRAGSRPRPMPRKRSRLARC
jgi:hypothetical protein